jgi:hypothetical protein
MRQRALRRQAPAWQAPGDERISPVILILSTGLFGGFVLPWLVLWLSDLFLFDVPGWSQWLAFVGPPAIGLLLVLIRWAARALSEHSFQVRVCAPRGH